MKELTKDMIRQYTQDIEDIVKSYCEERDIKLLDRRCVYNFTGEMKITLTIIPEEMRKNNVAGVTNDIIKKGLAPAGTHVKSFFRETASVEAGWYDGHVVSARNGRYSIKYDDGQSWRVPFINCEKY